METPPGYRPLDAESIRSFLSGLPGMSARLGGEPSGWTVDEVGDGNLNLVFLVDGPAGSLCVKQSLPYVRAAGEGWPMPLERAWFENRYYELVGPHVPGLTPEVFHYDPRLFAIVMEKLSPHIILRRGLIAGRRYPKAAADVAAYIAQACFFTSDLALPLERKFAAVGDFARNNDLRRITAELVFADPYRVAPRNRWTRPELDALAAEVREDGALKAAAARFGHKFLSASEALIHGDLHTGSVMVTEEDTRVIDPEFAIYGPIGFDLGAFVANLLMSYFSQAGHATDADDRRAEEAWLLEQIPVFWQVFQKRFRELWTDDAAGDAYPPSLFPQSEGRAGLILAQDAFMETLFRDMVGFAGVKTIRRIFGFAHNADFELIADQRARAEAETKAVRLARLLLTRPERFSSPSDIVEAAASIRHTGE